MSEPALLELTDSTFDAAIADGVTLVDFWAPWCGPCHAIAPALEALAATLEGRARVAKVNVDENPGVAARFRVMGLPTVMVFRDGRPVEAAAGARPGRFYRDWLERHAPGAAAR